MIELASIIVLPEINGSIEKVKIRRKVAFLNQFLLSLLKPIRMFRLNRKKLKNSDKSNLNNSISKR